MRQRYKKVGQVINVAGGIKVIKIVKVYVTNHLVDANRMVCPVDDFGYRMSWLFVGVSMGVIGAVMTGGFSAW